MFELLLLYYPLRDDSAARFVQSLHIELVNGTSATNLAAVE